MPLPLPNLDDRRWEDLVEEGRALVPFYAPGWTDHNASDPGITFIELLAWLAEIDVFRVNQVPESHRLKFLSLVGAAPRPPRAARTVLAFSLDSAFGVNPKVADPRVDLPAGLEFEGDDPSGQPTRFRLRRPITVVKAAIEAIHVQAGTRRDDMTARWKRREPFAAFGDNPASSAGMATDGNALILSFDAPLPAGRPIRLWFAVHPDLAADEEERARLLREAEEQAEACGADDSLVRCEDGGNRCEAQGQSPKPGGAPRAVWQCGRQAFLTPATMPSAARRCHHNDPSSAAARTVPAHHSARTVWEVQVGQDDRGRPVWRRLDPAVGEVRDTTRAFTLNGGVTVTLPPILAGVAAADPAHGLRRLRCRFAGGTFDAAPMVHAAAINAVPAEQAAAPAAAREAPGRPGWRAENAGKGTGWPDQRIILSEQPVVAASVRVYTVEGGRWRRWAPRADFDASGRADRHCVLDASAGEVLFGDGEHGRTAPDDAPIYVRYLATRAEQGNLEAGRVTRLADTPSNHALLGEDEQGVWGLFDAPSSPGPRAGATVTNVIAAAGGAAEESVVGAEGRALESVERIGRAVTLADYEHLAKDTPGVRLARAHARANVHPAFPCFLAPGIIALVILPHLPAGRPMPSAALRRAVAAYVNRRRVIGTRVEVVGPSYTEVSVRAKVRAHAGTSPSGLRQRIVDALNHFFDPLAGGPDSSGGANGTGWPFGRDVYRSEVLQVIDEVPGVDHVLALDLAADGGEPQCANLCLGAFGLVAAGEHRIEIVEGASA